MSDIRRADHLLKIAARKIKMPVEKWAGNCYAIAVAFIEKKIVPGVPRYGHWRGPVHEESQFFGSHEALGFSRHGWVEQPGETICDPTRWVFEHVEPYIFMGFDTENYYDLGGQTLRDSMNEGRLRVIRSTIFKKKDYEIVVPRDSKIKKVVHSFFPGLKRLTRQHLSFIANQAPDVVGPDVKTVYQWIIKTGNAAYIPVDNRMLILG